MKLKLDENGHVVVKDGFPVWVAEDGAEIAYNVPDLVNKISAVNAESTGRRKDIDALTCQLKAFDGIDPEKAKAAVDERTNTLTVAPGISEALIATAMGLLVAIPATIGYNTFHGSLGVLETRLVNFAGMFLNRVQRELNAHRAVSRSGQAE